MNQNASEFYKSDPEEKELEEGDRHPDTVSPFNAYAPRGVEEVMTNAGGMCCRMWGVL